MSGSPWTSWISKQAVSQQKTIIFHNVNLAESMNEKEDSIKHHSLITAGFSCRHRLAPKSFPAVVWRSYQHWELYSCYETQLMFDFWGSEFPKDIFHNEVKGSLKHCENRPWDKNETNCYDIIVDHFGSYLHYLMLNIWIDVLWMQIGWLCFDYFLYYSHVTVAIMTCARRDICTQSTIRRKKG